jgi:predicted RecA/RadA family phage recombinase
MQNYVQKGDTIAVTVASGSDAVDLSSGDGYLIGSLFGVAQHDAVIGAEVNLAMVGVFTLAKTTSQAWTVGQKAYWDAATLKVTTTASSNKQIGVIVATAGSADTTGNVLLNAAFTI